MATFRTINTNFWTDSNVVDDYTTQDKLFMLYALTNTHTNLCGCYEISIKQMSEEIGYSREIIESLIKKFTEVHKTIEYDFETKELLIKKWSKYNWNSSSKLDKPLADAISKIKSDRFHDYLAEIYNNRENDGIVPIEYRYPIDTLSIPYVYPTDTTISNSNSNSNSIRNSIYSYQNTLSIPYVYPIENEENHDEIEEKPKNEPKKKFGKFGRIRLKDKEYLKLCEEFSKDFIDKQIELLDEYVESNNNKNKYSNFNLVLRKSIRENWFKNKNNSNNSKPEWFDKEIKKEEMTEEETKEMEELLSTFK